jgi:hypothetical protein
MRQVVTNLQNLTAVSETVVLALHELLALQCLGIENFSINGHWHERFVGEMRRRLTISKYCAYKRMQTPF